MNIKPVDNQPSFEIKYMNKQAWNPQILKTFEKSELLKGIDKKYPKAEVFYAKRFEGDDIMGDDIHTAVMQLKLAKDKIFQWTLSSHSPDVPDEHFLEFLNKTTVEEVESKAVKELKPLSILEIRPHESGEKTLEPEEQGLVDAVTVEETKQLPAPKTSFIQKVLSLFSTK